MRQKVNDHKNNLNRSWHYSYVVKVSCVSFARIQLYYHIFRDERLRKIERMLPRDENNSLLLKGAGQEFFPFPFPSY